jgi:hypothetical protein
MTAEGEKPFTLSEQKVARRKRASKLREEGDLTLEGMDDTKGRTMSLVKLPLPDKAAFPQQVKTIIPGEDGWDIMPMGRVLRWFPQPGSKDRENPAGSTGVVRDHRPPRGMTARRRIP